MNYKISKCIAKK